MKYRLNHTPENIECFKVNDGKAFFQINGSTMHYQFASKREAEAWRNKRSLENRRSKVVEDFMACDESGLFCPIKRLKIFKALSIIPPGPTCLMELYAFNDVMGKKFTIIEEDDATLDMLERNKANRKPFERNIVTNPVNPTRAYKLRQLTERSGLPEHLGELFLSEIKLSTDAANEHLRDRVRFLGL
jgi:hypothetical protein